MCGIDVLVEHKHPEQHHPVFADQMQDAVPVQIAGGSMDDVNDVGAVKALATSDEELGCDQFLSGQNLHRECREFRRDWHGRSNRAAR